MYLLRERSTGLNHDASSKLEITIKPSVPDAATVALNTDLDIAVFHSPRHWLYLLHTQIHTQHKPCLAAENMAHCG